MRSLEQLLLLLWVVDRYRSDDRYVHSAVVVFWRKFAPPSLLSFSLLFVETMSGSIHHHNTAMFPSRKRRSGDIIDSLKQQEQQQESKRVITAQGAKKSSRCEANEVSPLDSLFSSRLGRKPSTTTMKRGII